MYDNKSLEKCRNELRETMEETGRDLQSAYRETGIGGLAKQWDQFK